MHEKFTCRGTRKTLTIPRDASTEVWKVHLLVHNLDKLLLRPPGIHLTSNIVVSVWGIGQFFRGSNRTCTYDVRVYYTLIIYECISPTFLHVLSGSLFYCLSFTF